MNDMIANGSDWRDLLDFMQQEEISIHNNILEITGHVKFIISPADESLFVGRNPKYNQYLWKYRRAKALQFIEYHESNQYDFSIQPGVEDPFDGYLYIVNKDS